MGNRRKAKCDDLPADPEFSDLLADLCDAVANQNAPYEGECSRYDLYRIKRLTSKNLARYVAKRRKANAKRSEE